MKLLVTGGAGFIGANFIRYLPGRHSSYEIVNYDKLTYANNLINLDGVSDRPHYSFVKGDICDPASVEKAMQGCAAVVHLAAASQVDRSIYAPAPVVAT